MSLASVLVIIGLIWLLVAVMAVAMSVAASRGDRALPRKGHVRRHRHGCRQGREHRRSRLVAPH